MELLPYMWDKKGREGDYMEVSQCIECEKPVPQKELIDGDFCKKCWYKDEWKR